MRAVTIRYLLRADADIAQVKAAITEFVSGLGGHRATVNYRSFELVDEPRRFMHVGEFHEEHVADLQKQAFFERFTAFLRTQCAEGPTVTSLRRVASTP